LPGATPSLKNNPLPQIPPARGGKVFLTPDV
jgi:hypothetical protein